MTVVSALKAKVYSIYEFMCRGLLVYKTADDQKNQSKLGRSLHYAGIQFQGSP